MAIGPALLQPDSVQGRSECLSSSPGVRVGAPVVAAVAGSPGELQIEACWEHSLLLPGNVLCPAPQEAPERRQWAASPSASPRPHRRRTRQTRGRQAWAVRSEPPGASQVRAPLWLGAPASGMGSWGPELITPGLGYMLWLSCRVKLSFSHWTVVRHSVGSGTKDAWRALVSYSWVELPLVSVARGGEETALPEQVGRSHRPPKGASETLGNQAQGGACKTEGEGLCVHRLRSCSLLLLS